MAVLCFSAQALAAPTKAQLNEKIKTLKDRVSFLEDAVADLKK
jgi:cell division protein FtsB